MVGGGFFPGQGFLPGQGFWPGGSMVGGGFFPGQGGYLPGAVGGVSGRNPYWQGGAFPGFYGGGYGTQPLVGQQLGAGAGVAPTKGGL